MKLSADDLTELAELAIEAAQAAGQMVARSRPNEVQHKPGAEGLAAQVVTEIDRRSEDIIVEILEPTLERFGLGLLTEEREDDGGRLTADHFWCVDPLDGTLPFIEGTPGYAVSIALVRRDGTPVIGVVHDPVELTLLHAIRGGGIHLDGRPFLSEPAFSDAAAGDVLSVFADRSFSAEDDHAMVIRALEEVAGEMGLAGVRVDASGGAVMNACRVLMHPPACYMKRPKARGGGSLWDFAATACLFAEAGAAASDMRGRPLDLNRADGTSMGHRGVLFATGADLATRLLDSAPTRSVTDAGNQES